jgi:hypothetical protein
MDNRKKSVMRMVAQAFGDTYDEDALARVAWATALEPGDQRAGRLITKYGAVAALDRLVAGQATGPWTDCLRPMSCQHSPSAWIADSWF